MVLGVSTLFAQTGGISQEREINAIQKSTMVDGKQTYPHGFHTNKNLQRQLQIDNSAKVDTLGPDGVRYQIKNPYTNKTKKSKAKRSTGGFTFADMAKRVNAK